MPVAHAGPVPGRSGAEQGFDALAFVGLQDEHDVQRGGVEPWVAGARVFPVQQVPLSIGRDQQVAGMQVVVGEAADGGGPACAVCEQGGDQPVAGGSGGGAAGVVVHQCGIVAGRAGAGGLPALEQHIDQGGAGCRRKRGGFRVFAFDVFEQQPFAGVVGEQPWCPGSAGNAAQGAHFGLFAGARRGGRTGTGAPDMAGLFAVDAVDEPVGMGTAAGQKMHGAHLAQAGQAAGGQVRRGVWQGRGCYTQGLSHRGALGLRV